MRMEIDESPGHLGITSKPRCRPGLRLRPRTNKTSAVATNTNAPPTAFNSQRRISAIRSCTSGGYGNGRVGRLMDSQRVKENAVQLIDKTRTPMTRSRFKTLPILRHHAARYPPFSRYARICLAASSAETLSVSITISGFSGASYGSSMPVNPMPLPAATAARAFL
jgi:hypothetical protein